MKKINFLLVTALLLAMLGGCAAPKAAVIAPTTSAAIAVATATPAATEIRKTEEPEKEYSLKIQIESEALAKNIIGDTSQRDIYIYLPPSYYENDKEYPMVYFLHGYGDSASDFINSNKGFFKKSFQKGAKEFIVVALDGNNKTGGSFYVNSPVMGNWDDFITREVISHVDENFRTLAQSSSRGIAGFSMGGFGALNLALKHPDVYGATLAFCPGVFAEEDFDLVMQSWQSSIRRSYAQAFSPDVEKAEGFSSIPEFSGTKEDKKVIAQWLSGFSNWGNKLDYYLSLNKPLSGIKVVYGKTDQYSWIPLGCEYLAKLCEEKGILNSEFVSFSGGHMIPPTVPNEYFIPFFNEHLNY